MKPEDQVPAVIAKVRDMLASKPECFVSHPAELKVLAKISEAELRDIAHRNGWRMVSRVGGRQIEFYNDVTVQQFESGRNQLPYP